MNSRLLTLVLTSLLLSTSANEIHPKAVVSQRYMIEKLGETTPHQTSWNRRMSGSTMK
jgi:hypothetical protein